MRDSQPDRPFVESLLAQVPVGLYDLGRTEGPLNIRVGADGEGYEGIRKDRVNVGGRICVADALGPCGNPTSDSARTMITTDTEHAAWIWFMPVGEEVVDRTAELVAQHGRGLISMAVPGSRSSAAVSPERRWRGRSRAGGGPT